MFSVCNCWLPSFYILPFLLQMNKLIFQIKNCNTFLVHLRLILQPLESELGGVRVTSIASELTSKSNEVAGVSSVHPSL